MSAPTEPLTGRPREALRLALKLLVGLALAAGFLYWTLRGSDLGDLWAAAAGARMGILALACLVAVSGFVLRAQRWICYLRAAKTVPLGTSFDILMMSYAVNLATGRLGDVVVRPVLMHRQERIPPAVTLATVAVERLFDAVSVLGFLAVYLVALAPAHLGALDVGKLRLAGFLLLGACSVVIAALVGLGRQRERYLRLLDVVVGKVLPARARAVVSRQARTFAEGLDLFADLRNAANSVILSVLIWVTVGVAMWLVTVAFRLDTVRLADACLLMGLGAVGIAVPTPGGAGSVSYFLDQGLAALGALGPAAKAAALAIWLLTPIPILALALVAFLRRGASKPAAQADAALEGRPA